jgi:phosphoenolpyruvate carboxylase
MRKKPVRFLPTEAALRDDVRLLGTLVGEALKEQGGAWLFRSVEAARKAAIRRREGDTGAEAELHRIVHSLSAGQAAEFVRAFSTYFQVVNLAESVHRIRRRRADLRSGKPPGWGTIQDVVGRLRAGGWSLQKVHELLDSLRIEPVFTSHPTQATRRSILEKQQRIARRLVERLDPSRTPPEERAALARIRAEITASWQTEEHPAVRPSVSDELENLLFYLTEVIYRVVPPFYEALEATLENVYGKRARSLRVPVLVRFASWVGGDMDGNPHVTPETIRDALSRQRALVLERYRREVLELSRQLTQSLSRVGVDARIPARVRRYASLFPGAMRAVPPRHRGMPYRVLLRLVAARLEASARDATGGYRRVEELQDDLHLMEQSLESNAGGRAGLFALSRLLRRVETFGFHAATLDVRQDALVHRRAVGRGLGDRGWLTLSQEKRAERIRRALRKGGRPRRSRDPDLRRSLAVFRAIAECRKRHGKRAIGPVIVSMAQGADDVLSVLLLARWGCLVAARRAVPPDGAPLFETITDLEAAPGILDSLLGDADYRSHLDQRGNRQVVMIGYSDSNKDGGLVASRWALLRVQERLMRCFTGGEARSAAGAERPSGP